MSKHFVKGCLEKFILLPIFLKMHGKEISKIFSYLRTALAATGTTVVLKYEIVLLEKRKMKLLVTPQI